jgi:hypothetical protein
MSGLRGFSLPDFLSQTESAGPAEPAEPAIFRLPAPKDPSTAAGPHRSDRVAASDPQ